MKKNVNQLLTNNIIMKQLRLLLALLILMIGGASVKAQTDVTSTYITNPSFEADGSITTSNGALTMTGWIQSDPTNQYNNTGCFDASTNIPTQGTVSVTPSDGSYFLYFRKGWAQNAYTFTTSEAKELPEGIYTLSVDYKMVEGYDNTQNNKTSVTISAVNGETTLATATGTIKTNVSGGSAYTYLNTAAWSTVTANFTLEEATNTTFVITLQAGGQRRSDFVIDNVRLNYTPYIRPTEIMLNSSTLSLIPTGTTKLQVTYSPNDANIDTDISWTTSDATVATVSDGVVTAVGPGTATITATTANNISTTCTVTVTDVTPVAAPAFFSEIGNGDFYIVNAATGKYFGGANSWGTQASLIEHGIPFTASLSDGKYTLDSHTYNKDYQHFVNGTYVDGNSTPLYIVALGDGKYSISTAEGSAYFIANPENNVVANSAPTANSVLAQWYFISKEDRDKLFESATDANPADATYYLREANISRNLRKAYNTSAWSGEFSYGGNDDNQCAERYCKTTDVYQTIDVPNGKYTVYCQGFYRRESGEAISYLYANDKEVALNRIESGGINSMGSASSAFSNGEFKNELVVYVTDGTLKVGIKCDATTNWTIWDNFELYYHGPTIGGEAVELADPIEAGKWYYFDIDVDGIYNLSTTTLSDIVYTNDGTILIENQSSVTTQFAGAENQTLAAGRYYVKSGSEQIFTVAPASYNYTLGEPVLSTTDGGYTQNPTFRVIFPNAVTNDPDGIVSFVDGSKATVNGNEVTLSAVDNGFSLDLGTLTANTDYSIVIPTNIYGYSDHQMNEAINITIHTPAVFDGEYLFYDETSKLFLGRGAAYGTEAVADKYGVPFNLVTDNSGISSLQFVDNNQYLFCNQAANRASGVYTDDASTGWVIVKTENGYSVKDARGGDFFLTHDLGTYGEYIHTSADAATTWSLKTKAERDAIIATYPSENISNVIAASNIQTTADQFETYINSNYVGLDYTSFIGTATFAGSNGDWTWSSYYRNQDGQPAYGTNFVEAWNATGAWSQTVNKENLPAGIYKVTVQGYERRLNNDASTNLYNNGYNLVSTYLSANGEQVRFTDWNEVEGKPTNTSGAVTAFNNNQAVNEVYVYLDGNTDLILKVCKPNYIWDCWAIMNNFTLTRYVPKAETVTIKTGFVGTTYSSENALDFSDAIEAGLKVYIITGTGDNGICTTQEVEKVPAGTGIYVEGEAGDYTANVYAGKDYDSVDGNLLVGTGAESKTLLSDNTTTYYMYGKQNGKESFFRVGTENARTASAHKAYLAISSSDPNAAKLMFYVGEGSATGINAVEKDTVDGEIYNLNGQRVNNARKGVYIVNGKKVIIK